MRQTGLISLLIALGLTAAIVHWWRGRDGTPSRPSGTAPELAQSALSAEATPDHRHAAVSALAGNPQPSSPSVPQSQAVQELRRLFRESTDPNVRAQSIESLALAWDYDAMDETLDALDDPSPHVRGRAAAAVARLTGRVRAFKADGPASQRQLHARHWRADWEEIKNSPHYGIHQQLQKASYEKRK